MSNETHSEKGLRELVAKVALKLYDLAWDDSGLCVSPDLDELADDLNTALLSSSSAGEAAPATRDALIDQCKVVEQMFDDGLSPELIQRYLDRRIHELNCALLAATPAVREPGPAITEAQAQDAYCDSFDTDAPAVAPAPDFKRLAKAINRFLVAPSSAGPATPQEVLKLGGMVGELYSLADRFSELIETQEKSVTPASAGEAAPATHTRGSHSDVFSDTEPCYCDAPAATEKGEGKI